MWLKVDTDWMTREVWPHCSANDIRAFGMTNKNLLVNTGMVRFLERYVVDFSDVSINSCDHRY